MIKNLTIKFVKSRIVKYINELLEKHKDDAKVIIDIIQLWILRLEKIISCFKNITKRLEDNVLDEDELNDSQDEIEKIIREW